MNFIRICVAAFSVFLTQLALADAFPTRPITIVVPFAAGGGTDMVARLVAQKLRESLKTGVIIENKPGATGQIGTRQVIQSAPDGYTLLLGTTSLINNPFLFSNIPYDAMKQLRPVVSVADLSIFLAVSEKMGAQDVREFIEIAKKNKGALNYGSAGAGTTLHLSAEWLKANAGFEATHIAFKGSGQAVVALAGGQVDFNMENLGAVQSMVQSKRVRLLAIAAPKRHPILPDVPTLGESGLPDINLATWIFLMAPTGTPNDVVMLLNKAVNQILSSAEIKDKLINMGFVPTGGTPDEMLKRMNQESVQWGAIIKSAHITIE
jgi:tripartite-type tricarboxylate transporter receptor subunit TctC